MTLEAKSAWFRTPVEIEILSRDFDFRVGGKERFHGRRASGMTSDFQAVYHDIVENERIILVYDRTTTTKSYRSACRRWSSGRRAAGGGTRLLHTGQGSYFSGGLDAVAGREHGATLHVDNLVALIERHEARAFT